MDIPREASVQFTLSPGAAYLLAIDGIPKQHYFVVLNYNPQTDEAILLVNATTGFENEAFYVIGKKLPHETLVCVKKGASKILPENSTFNCNSYKAYTYNEFIGGGGISRLRYMGVIETSILEELRNGFLASPLVKKKHVSIIEQS